MNFKILFEPSFPASPSLTLLQYLISSSVRCVSADEQRSVRRLCWSFVHFYLYLKKACTEQLDLKHDVFLWV